MDIKKFGHYLKILYVHFYFINSIKMDIFIFNNLVFNNKSLHYKKKIKYVITKTKTKKKK